MLRKIYALVKKYFLIEISYKLAFCFNVFSVVVTILTYFFIDKLFGHKVTPYLEEFGVNYFSYVLLSIAFFSYIGVGIGSFSSRIRQEQLEGTLESLFLSPTRISTLLFGMGLWNVMFATLNVIIYIGIGISIFNVDFSNANLISACIILILSIISFSGLGIISAAFIIVFKRGNPIGWVISTLEGLVGGVYFPISVMPHILQSVAKFLPITYAIRGIELAIYKGYSPGQLKYECGFLVLFSCLLIPLSFYFFKYALKKAKFQGSLIQY